MIGEDGKLPAYDMGKRFWNGDTLANMHSCSRQSMQPNVENYIIIEFNEWDALQNVMVLFGW
jgi:hypothetical protein